ncbi:MAG: hypothetical protein F8N37_17740 [Telmatospirillum sp.]|nr:hypothetical protein [Telmatospirillum sp.]
MDDLFPVPNATPSHRRSQSIVGTSEGRPDDDFYPTPRSAIEALLRVERFDGVIWEPACGDGAISRVLEETGHQVLSTDLIDRGYGRGGIDFLLDYTTRADSVVTNPPFRLAADFARHALTRTTGKVALLCKLNFLEGIKRKPLFEATPLRTVYVFSERLTMHRNGETTDRKGMIAFGWFVWDHAHKGPPTIAWL